MHFLEENKLILSERALTDCLQKNSHFQMQVFLERLVTVLKKMPHAKQQELLTNCLTKIGNIMVVIMRLSMKILRI